MKRNHVFSLVTIFLGFFLSVHASGKGNNRRYRSAKSGGVSIKKAIEKANNTGKGNNTGYRSVDELCRGRSSTI